MWTRKDLKNRAKDVLSNTYWMSFAACLLVSLIGGVVGAISSNSTIMQGMVGDDFSATPGFAVAGFYILSLIFSFFLLYPLSVNLQKFFLNATTGDTSLGALGFTFKTNYSNVVKAGFKQVVFIFLWSLLLIIPGIVKSYQYFLVEYLLAENPGMDSTRALQLSKAMMVGNKWRAFVLNLSFILWVILAMIPFGFGMLFLVPYVNATFTQFYLELKKNAIERGLAEASEFWNPADIQGE
jgi:uncharacterized membrane protein